MKSKQEGDEKEKPHPPKPPSKGEAFDDQSEEADNTGLYDRDEDMYSQDTEVLEEEE
jgi:hypothetical protein